MDATGTRSMAGAPIIAAESVSKRFGSNQVLTRVSLAVAEREVVCIVGPSGSGKTTLLRCLALLEEPSEGRVIMNGNVIAKPGRGCRRAACGAVGPAGHRHGVSALQSVAAYVGA
jgi:ABC-type sugar transport system ATPase subunit